MADMQKWKNKLNGLVKKIDSEGIMEEQELAEALESLVDEIYESQEEYDDDWED